MGIVQMKKIVMYIDSMCKGGAQRVLLNLAKYFLSEGVDIVLVNDYLFGADKEYEVPDHIKRICLQSSFDGKKLVKNIQRVCGLRSIIKNEHPDIVLSFLGHPNIRMLISSVGLKCKKIVSVRNDPRKEYGVSKIKRVVTRLLFCLADGCVFQTREASAYFSENIREKSRIIPNPVSSEFYNISPVQHPHNIVGVGRLENQKNHLLLIKAFSLIADEFPDVNLIIYGEGSLRKMLETEISLLKLEDRISLPGEISNVANELAKAKVFVLSSDYEGLPNALLEAMAVGLPCISTDCPCGGPKEIIETGLDGVLIECGNIEEMAYAIKELLENEGKRCCLGKNAKLKASLFRQENVYSLWREYFTFVLENN